EARSLTRSGDLIGTPAYMPPEQAVGHRRDVGPWSDIYGLGAVLFFTLSGEPPIKGTTVVGVLEKAVRGEITPLRSLAPSVPPALEEICRRALATDKTQRPTAEDLLAELDDFLRGGGEARRGIGGTTKLLVVLAVLSVVATVGLTFVATRGPRPPVEAAPRPTDSTPPRIEPAPPRPKERSTRLEQRWTFGEERRYTLLAKGTFVEWERPFQFSRHMSLTLRASLVAPEKMSIDVEVREFAYEIKRAGGTPGGMSGLFSVDYDSRRADEPKSPFDAVKGKTFTVDMVPATGEVLDVHGVEAIQEAIFAASGVGEGMGRRRFYVPELANSGAMRTLLDSLCHLAAADGVANRWRIPRRAFELSDQSSGLEVEAEFQVTAESDAATSVKWSGSAGDRQTTRGVDGKATVAGGHLRASEAHERFIGGGSSKVDFKVTLVEETTDPAPK
ncbi:MAG: serine/threonine protein kinase, partial [Planctomycetota bacterium]